MPLFTGTPLRARLYSGWGMTAIDITRVVLFSYITFWLGFIGLSGAAFLLDPIAVPALPAPADGERAAGRRPVPRR